MTPPDPKRVEVVARAIALSDGKDPNRPIGPRQLNLYVWHEYQAVASCAVLDLDAHDAKEAAHG